MIHFSSRTRRAQFGASMVAVSLVCSACQSDSVTSTNYTECSTEPGCQSVSTAVAPEVMQSLDDANSRVVAGVQPVARKAIESQLARLEVALTTRDIAAGRVAFAAVIGAIGQAERADSSARPDLGALRLNLVPAARSLGLSVSDTEASTP